MKCHIMKKNFTILRNQVELMPLYNRSHGQNKFKDGEDFVLCTHKKQIFLEKEIKTDDTLQSVALEFNIPIAELKRVNNIHKDNEIYARKVIKVPSNPLSLLLEKEYFLNSESSLEKNNESVQEKSDIIVETINNSNCVQKNYEDLSSEKEQKKYSFIQSLSNETQESVSLLSSTVENKTDDMISCNGADCGISWPILILITLVLGVGCPVLYVFWFLWKKEKIAGS